MGMILGADGKRWALQSAFGDGSNVYANLYLGLLETIPADFDHVEHAALMTHEFTPSADFYTVGRQEIIFQATVIDPPNGRYRLNANAISWPNANTDRDIAGVFISTSQSGLAGNVMWVGTPDIGSYSVAAGGAVNVPIGGILCGLD